MDSDLTEAKEDVSVDDALQQKLLRACSRGLFDKVIEACRAGAKGDKLSEDGWTPFGRAASGGHAEICRHFIKKGVDPNLSGNSGITALHEAARHGHINVILVLLENGATVDQTDENEMTPADYAKNQVTLDTLNDFKKETNSPQYKINEKILAHQGERLSLAKVTSITRSESSDTEDVYRVHFLNTSASYDTDLEESRILQLNQENWVLKTVIDEESGKSSKKPKKKKNASQKSSKRKRVDTKEDVEEDEQSVVVVEDQEESDAILPYEALDLPAKSIYAKIGLAIPTELWNLHVNDTTNVYTERKLLSIPRTPSVHTVLLQYQKEINKISHGQPGTGGLSADLVGLREVFNMAISGYLLARFERPQFALIQKVSPHTEPCDVFGPEHLLRLFVQLPELIVASGMKHDASSSIVRLSTSLMEYMLKNVETLFQGDYIEPEAEYLHEFG
eukprot:m.67623 g.67623  ORF g.67623 m.67623 type:complete len:449 (+) comp11903_c0_seq3:143-1489(+)